MQRSALNSIIRFALQNRLLTIFIAIGLLVFGGQQITELPIDVFPDLNRPRVVVMTEAHGMAPEEVETLVTIPLETVLSGASGVQAVRSSSGIGISVIYVEFDWGTDINIDRQVVLERLAIVSEKMREQGIHPQLAPVSSIMGQIMVVGMTRDPRKKANTQQATTEDGEPKLDPLRTLADWTVRKRLRTIPGVSQVFVMGGQRKQFQVLLDPDLMLRYGVNLEEVKTAIEKSNRNTTGGYLDDQGPNELQVRILGRIQSIKDLKEVVVKIRDEQSVVLNQIARVIEGAQQKRGTSSSFVRDGPGTLDEKLDQQSVLLTITKQPGSDTRQVTNAVLAALEDLKATLPDDVILQPNLYQQKSFIDRAIANVQEALLDGGILVVIILFIFLMNFRTTFITLTAIPLSIVMTGIIFSIFGISINTMTLGGLAVAIGELVDDAIVDVENIFRRLRENRNSDNPKNPLLVVYKASLEVRNSIVYGTVIVVLVFLPLFSLSGMEGRLFTPLGTAYIVSILASLLVSLTVTPVLSYWLLSGKKKDTGKVEKLDDGFILRFLKILAGGVIRFSLRIPSFVLLAGGAALILAIIGTYFLERDFLPPFNEGAAQINVLLPQGTSLKESNKIAKKAEKQLMQVEGITTYFRKTGRAELDEHAEGVEVTEFVASLDPNSKRTQEEIIHEVRERLAEIPGIVVSDGQPLAHLIDHMLSGVQAQVAVKLYGDDLSILREKAKELKAKMETVVGVKDPKVEPQIDIPQLRIEVKPKFGLRNDDIILGVETALSGHVVSQVILGEQSFDLLVRLDEPFRENIEAIKRLSISLPNHGTVKLESVARIYNDFGPSIIKHEKARKRIVVSCNVTGRGLVDVVEEIQAKHADVELPKGYFLEYGGQFESQQAASHKISLYSIASLFGVLLVLFTLFRSLNLSLQVMVALPMAMLGGVAALYITQQSMTIAAMVGFISLCGIATRNGILLINHYLHLVEHEGEGWTKQMIVRAGKERLAPVLMTALTSGIGLLPLALAGGESGKEILYPIATVILGGLLTSTTMEFLVRPALFWKFGTTAAAKVLEERKTSAILLSAEE